MNTMTATSEITRHAPVTEWTSVCEVSDLLPDTGVCALINQKQIAIFHSRRLNEYFAIGNYDPIGEANVLSRGIIGSIGDAVVVASPLYKQHFNLRTGECLEKPEHTIPTYAIRVQDGLVQVHA
jgi:nitrite reductase (NADH) small subunit